MLRDFLVALPLTRWLILTQYYSPEIGAPQIRLRSVARELRRYGIEVEILTAMPNYPVGKIFPGYSGNWRMSEEIDGIPVRRTWIYAGTGKSAYIRLANYLSFTFTALLAALNGPRPDVMFVESQPLSLGTVAVLMKWLRGVPYIYNVPDLHVDVARQLGFVRSEAVLRLALMVENFFLHRSWKISTVTQPFIEHFQQRGLPREQITFLPNGADTNFLKPQAPDEELLTRWGLHGKHVFVYVGTQAYYHGLDILIETATLLHDRPDIVFLIMGDGPERKRLIRMSKSRGLTNIIFGQTPYEELSRLYSIAHASIATLRKMDVAKNMRLAKVFPSLSCGVPVIFAGIGETADLLEVNKCGLVVHPEEPALLAEAVERLASNEPLRYEMGCAGRELVEREYSWSAIVGCWVRELGILNAPANESKA
jgi:glycosyltransferase involved in cell wall biosynthesis